MEKIPEQSLESVEQARLFQTQEIYRAALSEHADFGLFPEAELKQVIKEALREIDELEDAGDPKKALGALSLSVAENVKALWVFSGSGTYDKPFKDDAYEKISWAHGMDRARLNRAAWLVRKIAEIRGNEAALRGSLSRIPEGKVRARELILKYAPLIIYNGREDESAVVRAVLTRAGVVVPREKVLILGEGIRNTRDQVKAFALPDSCKEDGKEIGLVSHAPHLMRIAHMLNRYRPLPDDMKVRLFPIASPPEARAIYAAMEVKGLLYYLYLDSEHAAAAEPCSYIIHGSA